MKQALPDNHYDPSPDQKESQATHGRHSRERPGLIKEELRGKDSPSTWDHITLRWDLPTLQLSKSSPQATLAHRQILCYVMANPGLIFVHIRPTHPALTASALSDWYDQHCAFDIFPHCPIKTRHRYSPVVNKSSPANDASKWQHLAMFPEDDIAWYDTGEADEVNGKSDLLPEKDKSIFGQAELFRWYKKVGGSGKNRAQGRSIQQRSTLNSSTVRTVAAPLLSPHAFLLAYATSSSQIPETGKREVSSSSHILLTR